MGDTVLEFFYPGGIPRCSSFDELSFTLRNAQALWTPPEIYSLKSLECIDEIVENEPERKRFYFTSNETDSPERINLFNAGLDEKEPVEVEASQRFTEFIMGVDLEKRVYNIRVALNLENLNIDEIESISFSQRHGIYFGGLE
ncbi:hypothetical protein BGZ65_006670, partial [Modicella reniformis]